MTLVGGGVVQTGVPIDASATFHRVSGLDNAARYAFLLTAVDDAAPPNESPGVSVEAMPQPFPVRMRIPTDVPWSSGQLDGLMVTGESALRPAMPAGSGTFTSPVLDLGKPESLLPDRSLLWWIDRSLAGGSISQAPGGAPEIEVRVSDARPNGAWQPDTLPAVDDPDWSTLPWQVVGYASPLPPGRYLQLRVTLHGSASDDRYPELLKVVVLTRDHPADSTPPENVTNLDLQPGNDSMLVSWTPGVDSAGDQVTTRIHVTDSYVETQSFDAGDGASYRVEGLANGETYTFRVTTQDASMNESSGVSADEVPGNVAPPLDVTALAAYPADGFADLVWQPPADIENDLDHLLVELSRTGAVERSFELPADATVATVQGLANGTTYGVTVKAVDSDGLTSAGVTVTLTPQAAPAVWIQPRDTVWPAGAMSDVRENGSHRIELVAAGSLFAASGTYISPVHDLAKSSGTVWWQAMTPSGSSIDSDPGTPGETIELRASPVRPVPLLELRDDFADADLSDWATGSLVDGSVTGQLAADDGRVVNHDVVRGAIGRTVTVDEPVWRLRLELRAGSTDGQAQLLLHADGSSMLDLSGYALVVSSSSRTVELRKWVDGTYAVLLRYLSDGELVGRFDVRRLQSGYFELSVDGASTAAALTVQEQDLNPFPLLDRLELLLDPAAYEVELVELAQAWRSDLPVAADDPVWSALPWQELPSGAIALPAGRYVQLRTTLNAGAGQTATPEVIRQVVGSQQAAQDSTPPANVTGFEATGLNGFAELSWTRSSSDDVIDQILLVDDGSGFDAGTRLGAEVVGRRVDGLNNGVTYTFRLVVEDHNQNLSSGAETSATPDDRMAPEDVTGFAAAPGNHLLDLSWQPSINSEGDLLYHHLTVEEAASGTAVDSVDLGPEALGHRFAGLSNGVLYRVRMVLEDTTGNLSAGVELTATPENLQAPEEVSSLSASPHHRRVVLSWVASADSEDDLIGYRLRVSDDNGLSWGPATDLAETVLTTTVTDLSNGVTYSFKVSCVDDGGLESSGVVVNATPANLDPPEDVDDLSAALNGDEVTLSWTVPTIIDDDLTTILVHVSADEGATWSSSGVLGPAATGHLHTVVLDGTEYRFRVRTEDEAGNRSAGRDILVDTSDNDPPGEVAGLRALAGEDNVVLSWIPSPHAGVDLAEQVLSVSDDGGSSWDAGTHLGPSAVTHRVSDLTLGQSYRFRLVMVDSSGNESSGRTVDATPVEFPDRWIQPVSTPWTRGDRQQVMITASDTVVLTADGIAAGSGAHLSPVHDLGSDANQVQWYSQELDGSAIDSSPGGARTIEYRAADVPPARARPTLGHDFTSHGLSGWGQGSVVLEAPGELTAGGSGLFNSTQDGLGVVSSPISFTGSGWVLDLHARPHTGGVVRTLLVSSGTAVSNWSGYDVRLEHDGSRLQVVVDKVVLGEHSTLLVTARAGTSSWQRLRVLLDAAGQAQALRDGDNLTRFATTQLADPNPFSSLVAIELGLEGQHERVRSVELSRFWVSDLLPSQSDPLWGGLPWQELANGQSVGIIDGRFVQLRTTLRSAAETSPTLIQTVVGTVDPQTDPDTTPPQPATDLVGTPGDQSAQLDWLPSVSADLANQMVVQDGLEVMDLGPNAAEVTVRGLQNGTTYSFKIRSIDDSGNVADSASVQVTPADTEPPADVLALTATPGNHLIDLSWQPNPANGGVEYSKELEITNLTTSLSWTESVAAAALSYRVSGLDNGTSYQLTLSTIDDAGNHSPGVSVTATPSNEQPPEDVTGLTAYPGDGLVDLEWVPSANSEGDAAATLVYRESDDGHSWLLLDTLAATAAGYRAAGLANGVYLTFKVSVRDAGGVESRGVELRTVPVDFPSSWTEPIDTPWSAGDPSNTEPVDDGRAVQLVAGAASGTFISPVHDMGRDASTVWWLADELNGTLIDTVPGGPRTVEVRASDVHPVGWAPLTQDQLPDGGDPVWSTLPYVELTNGEALGGVLDGRYVQLKVSLHSDATQTYSPTLHRLSVGAGAGADTVPPDDVQNLEALPGNRQVTLEWQASPSSDVIEQLVRVSDGAGWSNDLLLPSTVTSTVVGDLTNGQQYAFTVSCSDGWGWSRGVTATAMPSDVEAPPEVQSLAAAPGHERLHVSWTSPDDPGGDVAAIELSHRLASEPPGSEVLDVTLGASATSHTLLDLVNGTSYVVHVATVDAAGNSSLGVEVAAAPANVTAPEEVTDLHATPGDGRVDLRWTSSADSEGDLSGYRLYLNDGTGYDAGRDLAADAVYVQAAGLHNNVSYALRLTTVDAAGNESNGTIINATPVPFADYWHNPGDVSWAEAIGYGSPVRVNGSNEIVMALASSGTALFVSVVHDFGENGAKVCWQARELRDTRIAQVEVRSSPHPPLENWDQNPWQPDDPPRSWPTAGPWVPVENGVGGAFTEGRYVQYRVTLESDPEHRYSPALRYVLLATDDASDCTAPDEITGLEAFPGDTTCYFTWTESANSEGDLARQTIYVSTDHGFTWGPGEPLEPFATYERLDGLTNFVEHLFRITTTDVHGNESEGTTVTATPVDLTAPEPVSDLVVALSGDTAYLSWTASPNSEGDLEQHRIDIRRQGQSEPFRQAYAGAAATSVEIDELPTSSAYVFTVFACDEVPNCSIGVPGGAGDSEPPDEIPVLSALPGDTLVTVLWQASPDSAGDLDGYRIWLDGAPLAEVDPGQLHYRAEGLINGTSYSFRVTAFDLAGNESAGRSADATPVSFDEVHVLPLATAWSAGQLNNLQENPRGALELIPSGSFADGGSFVSPVIDLGGDLAKLWWNGLLPPGTEIDSERGAPVTVEVRTSEVPPTADAGGGPWQSGDPPASDARWGTRFHEDFNDDFGLSDRFNVRHIDSGITIEEDGQELRFHGVTERVTPSANSVSLEMTRSSGLVVSVTVAHHAQPDNQVAAGLSLRHPYVRSTIGGWATHVLEVVWTGSSYVLRSALVGSLGDRWLDETDLGVGHLDRSIPLEMRIVPRMVPDGAGGGYVQEGWLVETDVDGVEVSMPYVAFPHQSPYDCTIALFQREDSQVGDVIDVGFDDLRLDVVETSTRLTWQDIEPGQSTGVPIGRFAQVRVSLHSDADDRFTPRLSSLQLATSAAADDSAPADVTGLTATPSGPDWQLSWSASSSSDVDDQVLYLSTDSGETWDAGVSLGAAATSTVISAPSGVTLARVTVLDLLLNESAGAVVALGVDVTPPVIVSSMPPDGGRASSLPDGIVIDLSDDFSGVDGPATVAGAIVAGSVDGPISGAWLTAVPDQVRFVPDQPLTAQHYTVALSPTDRVGNSADVALHFDLYRFKDPRLVARSYDYAVLSEDGAGNRSRPTDPVVAEVLPPSAPTGVASSVDAETVTLTWQPSPEPNVVGYIVSRRPAPDRDAVPVIDGTMPLNAGQVRVTYDYSFDDPQVSVDGSLATTVRLSTGAPPPWIWQVRYDDLQSHLQSLKVHWGDELTSRPENALDYTIETWDEVSEGWQEQIAVVDNDQGNPVHAFPPNVHARRLRLVVTRGSASGLGEVRDVELTRLAPLTAPTAAESAVPLGTNSYEVRAIDDVGNLSAPTEHLVVVGDIASPSNLQGSALGHDVTLTWDHLPEPAPGAISGYHVYRDGARITATPVATRSYAETLFENDDYAYFVTAVRASDSVETLPSNTVVVTVDDTLFPFVPQDVTATFGYWSIAVSWSPVSAPNLLGYNVYRVGVDGPLNSEPLDEPGLVDSELVYRQAEYVYTVTAVDINGAESAHSAPAVATALPPTAPDWISADRRLDPQPVLDTTCYGYPHYVTKSDIDLDWSDDGFAYFVVIDGDVVPLSAAEVTQRSVVFAASTVAPAPGDSALFQQHHPAVASDTSLETFWQSADTDPSPTWQVELEREEPVEGIDVHWLEEFDHIAVDFQVETWDTALADWQVQATVSGNDQYVNHVRFSDLVYTSKVRLVVTSKVGTFLPVAATEILVRIPERISPQHVHHAITVGLHSYRVIPEHLGFTGPVSDEVTVWVPEADLHVADFDVFVIPRKPSVLNTINLAASVRNPSAIDLSNVVVRFYDGDPDAGAVALGETTISSLTARSVELAKVVWDPTPADAGDHQIVAVVDPDDLVEEWDETNNRGSYELTVHAEAVLDVRVDEIDAGEFELITVRVRVDDHTGRGLNGLEPSNFTVFEDGVEQQIVELVPLVTEDNVLPKVDMVFIGDTSGSMGEEYEDVTFILFNLLRMAEFRGIDLAYSLLTIERPYRWGEPFDLGLFDGEITDVNHTESWGPMSTYLAQYHPWRDGAVRLLLPISDEYPYEGTDFVCCPPDCDGRFQPVTTSEDYQTLDEAIAACQANDVIAYPLYGFREWFLDCAYQPACEPLSYGFMQSLAQATDGRTYNYWEPYAFLEDLGDRVETNTSNYLVRYRTSNITRDGSTRHVDVHATYRYADGMDDGEYVAPLEEVNLTVAASDLHLSEPTPLAGDEVTVSAAVHNYSGAAASNVLVRLFDGDPIAGGVQLGSDQVIPQLLPGEAVLVSASWIALHGQQTLTVVVDPLQQIDETDETDNLALLSVFVPGDPRPELAIHLNDVEVSDTTPTEGEPVLITAIVHNVGADVEAFTVIFSEGRPEDGGRIIAEHLVPSLAAESFVDLEAEWSTAGKEGPYDLWVVVDPQNVIDEVNEDNNRAARTVTVHNKPVTLSITTDRSVYTADDQVLVTVACNNRLAEPFTGEARITIDDPDGDEAALVGQIDLIDVPTQILPEWPYRVPLMVDLTGAPAAPTLSAEADLNFTFLLNELEINGTFDPASVRVVEFDGFGVLVGIVAHRLTPVDDFIPGINERGMVEWGLAGEPDAAGRKYYRVYFDILEHGAKPDTSTGVTADEMLSAVVGAPEELTGSGVVTLTWPTGQTQAGTYVAAGTLAENGLTIDDRSSEPFVIVADESLTADVNTDRSAYHANEWVELRSRILNASRNHDFTDLQLDLEVRDPADQLVHSTSHSQSLLIRGQLRDFTDQWNTTTSPAGTYSVELTVSDGASTVASAATTFDIVASDEWGGLVGAITASPVEASAGEPITMSGSVLNNGNSDLVDVQIHTVVVNGASQAEIARFSSTHTLLQGDEVQLSDVLDTAGHGAGPYLVLLQAERDGARAPETLDSGGYWLIGAGSVGLAKAAEVVWQQSSSTFLVTLTFTVTSYGSDQLTQLQVTDDLDAVFGVDGYSVTSVSSAEFTVNAAYDGSATNSVLVGTDVLASGATGTITVVLETAANGLVENSATVEAFDPAATLVSDQSTDGLDPDADGDGDPGTDSVPTPIDLRAGAADLAVELHGPPAVSSGGPISFTAIVRNLGPEDATGVVLDDATPDQLTFASATPPCDAGFPCVLGDLTAGGELAIDVDFAVPASYSGPDPLINTVSVSGAEHDGDLSNNTMTSASAVDRAAVADLAIHKSGPAWAARGSIIAYDVAIDNNGTDNAAGVLLTDPTPAGLVAVAIGAPCAGGFPCAVGALNAGYGTGLQSQYELPADHIGHAPIVNLAAVTNSVDDPYLADNSAEVATVPVASSPVLGVAKAAEVAYDSDRSLFVVTITATIENLGNEVIGQLQLTDDLDATFGVGGHTVVSIEAPALTVNPAFDGSSTSAVLAGSDSLSPATSALVTFVVEVPAPGTYSNQAAGTGVSADSATALTDASTSGLESDPDGDFDPGNNFEPTSIVLENVADVGVTLSSPALGVVGEELTYSLTVSNFGPAPSSVTVQLPTPAGLVPVSVSAPCDGGFPCVIDQLTAGSPLSLEATIEIPPAYSGADPIVAQALVSGDSTDPDLVNNTATASTPLERRSNLSVSLLNGVDQLVPGTAVSSTLVVVNDGPSAVTGAIVTTSMSPELGTVSWSCVPSAGASCGAAGSGDVADTVLLAVGAGVTYTVTGTVDPAATGDLMSSAEVVSPTSWTDPDLTDNTASDSDPLVPSADLSISKSGPSSVLSGEELTSVLTVVNHGPSTAAAVVVDDPTPTGLQPVSADPPCAGGFPCDLGYLQPDEVLEISVTHAVPTDYSEPDPIVNVATVTSSTDDPDPTDNSGSSSTAVDRDPMADLAVTKTGPVSAVIGLPVVYTVGVSNLGPDNATDLVIADPGPSSLVMISASPPCEGGFPCTVPSLSAGSHLELEVSYQLPLVYDGADPIVNTAAVSGSTEDPEISNNSTTVETPLGAGGPSLGLAKSASVTYDGGSGTWSVELLFTVANLGTVPLEELQLTDDLAGVFASGAFTVEQLSSSTLSVNPAFDGDSAIELLTAEDVLAAGANEQILLTLEVATPGSYSNSATVTARTAAGDRLDDLSQDGTDPDPDGDLDATNNDAPTAIVLAAADLAVSKNNGVDHVAPGTQVAYQIVVENLGPSHATGVRVADAVPAALTSASWNCSATGGGSCAPNGTGDIDELIDLPAGEQAQFVLSGSVLPTASGELTNSATVTGPAGLEDPDHGNNEAIDSDPIVAAADLTMVVDGPSSVLPGGQASYQLTVRNLGPSPAQDVVLDCPTPFGLSLVVVGDPCAGGFPCALGTLDATAQLTVGVTYSVPVAYSGPDPFTVTSTVVAATTDPAADNNTAIVETTVTDEGADLELTLTGPGAAVPGTALDVSMTVTNLGTSVATTTVLDSVLPPGISVDSISSPCSSGFPCELGDLSPGGSVTVEMALGLPSAYVAPDPLMLQAVVSSSTADGVPGNNSGDVAIPVRLESDLWATKHTDAGVLVPGQLVTYMITVGNAGPSDAVAATVSDTIPDTLVDPVWTCSPYGGATCTGSGVGDVTDVIDLPAGDQVEYILTARFEPPDRCHVTNTVNVTPASGVVDPDDSNNSASVTTEYGLDRPAIGAAKAAIVALDCDGGHLVTMTFTVEAFGPEDLDEIQLTDDLAAVFGNGDFEVASLASSELSVNSEFDGSLDQRLLTGSDVLAAGDTATVMLELLVDQAGTFLNRASASAISASGIAVSDVSTRGFDPDPDGNEDPGDNSEGTVVAVRCESDLRVAIEAPGSIESGQILAATLNVHNDGPLPASGLVLMQPPPAGLELIVATDGPCIDGFPCSLGTLPVHGTVVVGISYQVPDGYRRPDPILLVTSVRGDQTDPDPDNNVAFSATAVDREPEADLSVAGHAPQSVAPLTSSIWLLHAHNHGLDNAEDVLLGVETGELELVSAAGPCAGGFPCTIGGLNSGAAMPIRLELRAPEGYAGPAVVSVAISASTNDPDLFNNEIDLTASVGAAAVDAAIGLSGPPLVQASQPFFCELVLSNLGPTACHDLSIELDLEQGLELVSADGPCAGGFPCSVSELEPGALVPVRAELIARAGGVDGMLELSASVVTTEPDCVPGNNSAAAAVSLVTEAADVVVTAFGPVVAVAGRTMTHTVVVVNEGLGTAAGAVLDVGLPVGMNIVGVSAPCDGGLPCDMGDLGPGSSMVATVTSSVPSSAEGTIGATFSAFGRWAESDPATNSATVMTPVLREVDLSIAKDNNLLQVGPGQPISYEIQVTNSGPSDVDGAVVYDALPVDLIDVWWTCAPSGGATCSTAGSGSLEEPVTLPSGSSIAMILGGTVAADAEGSLINVVTVSPPTAVVELDSSDNSAMDADSISAPPELVVTKVASSSEYGHLYFAGEVVTWTVTITNDSAARAYDVEVQDAIGAWAIYLSGSMVVDGVSVSDAVDGDAGSYHDGELVVSLGDVTGGVSREVRFDTVLDSHPSADQWLVSNQAVVASVHGQELSDDPLTSEPGDPTEILVAQRAIPALAPIGLATLLLLMACAGVILARRRG